MLTKKVNGVSVQLTPEEEVAVRAEWAINKNADVQQRVEEDARLAARDANLANTSADSITALRDEINILKTLLRDEL